MSHEHPRWVTLSEDKEQAYDLTYGVGYVCTHVAFDQHAVVFLRLASASRSAQLVLTTQEMERFLAVYQEESTRMVSLPVEREEKTRGFFHWLFGDHEEEGGRTWSQLLRTRKERSASRNEHPRWVTLSEDKEQAYDLTYGVGYACTKVAFDQHAIVFLKLSTGPRPEQLVLTTQEMECFLAAYQEESTRTVPLPTDAKEAHP